MKQVSTRFVETTAEQMHFIASLARWEMLRTATTEQMLHDQNFLKIKEIRKMLSELDDNDIIIITTMPF